MWKFARCFSASARSLLTASMLAFCGPCVAATITLKDGTVIKGEVKSLQNGVYTVETASVGIVHVNADQVRSIDEGSDTTSPSPVASVRGGAASGTKALDAAKSQIAQDPKLLATVLELESDPDMISVLNDADIAKAIAAGDYASLMSNPKIIALMQNPKVRAIVDGVR